MNATSFDDLRAQVEAKMHAMAESCGVTTNAAAIHQVCFVIAGLASPGGAEDLRRGDTAEQVLGREEYLAWVAQVFAEEVTQYHDLFDTAVLEFMQKTGRGGTTEQAIMQYLTIVQRDFFS